MSRSKLSRLLAETGPDCILNQTAKILQENEPLYSNTHLEKHKITNFPCDTIYGCCTPPNTSLGGEACPASKFLSSHMLPVGASCDGYDEYESNFSGGATQTYWLMCGASVTFSGMQLSLVVKQGYHGYRSNEIAVVDGRKLLKQRERSKYMFLSRLGLSRIKIRRQGRHRSVEHHNHRPLPLKRTREHTW